MDKKQPSIDNKGNKRWFVNGKLHRIDGPAIEYMSGGKEWHLYGNLHREDGPAVVGDAVNLWYLNDLLHREDGPAAECANGDKEWYSKGMLHRTDGPAIEYMGRGKEWWLNSVWLSFEEWLAQTTGLTDEEKVMMKLKYG
jgi:hypothetical protein